MIKFRRYGDISFFSYFSIMNYVALLCALLSVFLPTLHNRTDNVFYNLSDLLGLGYTSISLIIVFIIFSACLLFVLNMFFQPSWMIFFIDFALIVYLFISPVLLNFKLLPLLNLSNNTLLLYVGGILIMISAMLYTAIEIYKVSIMDVFVNRELTEKKERALQLFMNSRRYRIIDKKTREQKKSTFKKHYQIKRPRLKSWVHHNKAKLQTTAEYTKYLDQIYKI